MKAMLTGPVTMLKWSFVRDDQPEADTARQVALALRDEVADLERAGLGASRWMSRHCARPWPLRREDWPGYLSWAVESFRLATSGVADTTQIHTHMCYSEFGEILDVIAELGADVTSGGRLLPDGAGGRPEAWRLRSRYRAGVYDIHSPRVPATEDMAALLGQALEALDPAQLWVNPDCGLKTRGYEDVEPALRNLVEAAARVRATLSREG